MLRRYPRWQPGVDKALGLLEKYSTAFILSFRFVYGIRNFSSFAATLFSVGEVTSDKGRVTSKKD